MAVEAVGVSARQLTSAVRIHFVAGLALRARVGGGAGVAVGVVTGQFARAGIQSVPGIARRARVGGGAGVAVGVVAGQFARAGNQSVPGLARRARVGG